eukprot:GILJ01013290.1.p1 GENE.GILJ01013290.1~~GILJ01013290.1.p1  ORF type:complete len:675 (+),score=167.54 GILJ01013290.1:30-2027(+)
MPASRKRKLKVEESDAEEENSDQQDEDEDDNDEEDGEEEEVLQKKELPQRGTRGQRMNVLVGEAAEQDEAFWTHEDMLDAEHDDEYEASTEEEDEIDSDFDAPEEEEQFEVAEEDKRQRKTAPKIPAVRKPKRKQKLQNNHATEVSSTPQSRPSGARRAPPRQSSSVKKEGLSTQDAAILTENRRKSVRSTTLKQTVATEKRRKQEEAKKASAKKPLKSREEQYRPSQEEMLAEAAVTEVFNQQSLEELLKVEEEKRKDPSEKPKFVGPMIRYVDSARPDSKVCTTLTFTDVTDWPTLFNQEPDPYPTKAVCGVTKAVAKYYDPATETFYSTVDAFKILRERRWAKDEELLQSRINLITNLVTAKRQRQLKLEASAKAAAEKKQNGGVGVAPKLENPYSVVYSPSSAKRASKGKDTILAAGDPTVTAVATASVTGTVATKCKPKTTKRATPKPNTTVATTPTNGSSNFFGVNLSTSFVHPQPPSTAANTPSTVTSSPPTANVSTVPTPHASLSSYSNQYLNSLAASHTNPYAQMQQPLSPYFANGAMPLQLPGYSYSGQPLPNGLPAVAMLSPLVYSAFPPSYSSFAARPLSVASTSAPQAISTPLTISPAPSASQAPLTPSLQLPVTVSNPTSGSSSSASTLAGGSDAMPSQPTTTTTVLGSRH